MSYWETTELKSALRSNADIFAIVLGVYDSKEFNWVGLRTKTGDSLGIDYLELICELRQNNPRAQIVVVSPPPIYDPYRFRINGTIVNEILPSLLKTNCETSRCNVYRSAYGYGRKDRQRVASGSNVKIL